LTSREFGGIQTSDKQESLAETATLQVFRQRYPMDVQDGRAPPLLVGENSQDGGSVGLAVSDANDERVMPFDCGLFDWGLDAPCLEDLHQRLLSPSVLEWEQTQGA
jgi:hypothetical protein